MGKATGFKEYDRKKVPWRLPVVRLHDYEEIYTDPNEDELRKQGTGAWIAVSLFASQRPVARSTI